MIKLFFIKYYVYISLFIIGLLSVGVSFQSYKLSLAEYNAKVLLGEKALIINTLEASTARQQLVIATLQSNYKSMSDKKERDYEQSIKLLEDDRIKSMSTVSSLHKSIDNLRDKITNPSTTNEELQGLISRYERISKECSSRYNEVATDADGLKVLVIDLNTDNDNLREIVRLHNELNK